ncbi:MAG TPA: PDR/VanB family oxidoreductase [Microbacteriaceae bacterium]
MSAETAFRADASEIKLRVEKKVRVSNGVTTLTLVRPDGKRLPDWTPGSHIDLVLPDGTTRQYSLCGDRWDPHRYRIGVLRERDGRGGSAFICDTLPEGAMVGLGGPRNNFRLVPSEKYLFIAGGIGITPMLPMVQQAEMLDAEWQLVYIGHNRHSMAFLDELERYGDRVSVLPKDECGRFLLSSWIREGRDDTKVYMCGPASLLDEAHDRCGSWPTGLLRVEHFVPKEQGAPVRDDPFEVELAQSGLSVTVAPEVSIVDALKSAGINLLTSCKQGTCGTCEVAVLAGEPDHRDSILDDDERACGDRMFPCVSRSCSDRLIFDL